MSESKLEKVIKGLEILINGCEYIHCDDCCFYISTKPLRCGLREEQIKEDALALLKEQEAVKPRVSTAEQRCGHCNKVIEMDGWITCPWCGKMIDWKRWWNKNGTHDNT